MHWRADVSSFRSIFRLGPREMSHELPDPPNLTNQNAQQKSTKMKFREDIEIDSLENSRPTSPESNRQRFYLLV